jgi:hypothetical protein
MDYQKQFQIGEIPDAFKKEVNSTIRLYSIIMLILDEDESHAIPCSGTLCKIEQHFGILTARHVWDEPQVGIKHHKVLKIIVGGGAYSFDVDSLQSIEPPVEGELYDGKVPDITFVKIPSELSSKIEAFEKIFYSIDKRIEDEELDLYGEDGYWTIFGSPVERLNIEQKSASSTIYGTSIPVRYDQKSWDYLELEVLSEEGKMPEIAKGFSGGGIWRTKFAVNSNLKEFCIIDIILSGVNFYQTNIGESYKIVGHGLKSIYENIYGLVAQG